MDRTKKILQLLGQRGWSKVQLADRAALKPRNVSYIINGSREPGVSSAIAISRALEVSTEWLFDDKQGWPPRTDSIINIPDTPLVSEIARRRQMIRADMWSIVQSLQSDGLIDWASRIAVKSREATSDSELKKLIAILRDLRQLDNLSRRLSWIDPDDSLRPEDEPPSGHDLIQNSPRLLHMLEYEEATNAAFKPLDRSDRAVPLQHIVPFSSRFGEIVTRQAYAGMGVFQQRGYVPMLEDLKDAPPSEKPLLIHRGQSVPDQFRSFVRCDDGGPRSFAYPVDSSNMEPQIANGSIVICDPDCHEESADDPKLFIFDDGQEHGIYRLKGSMLHSSNAKQFKPRRLKDGDRIIAYPIVAVFTKKRPHQT